MILNWVFFSTSLIWVLLNCSFPHWLTLNELHTCMTILVPFDYHLIWYFHLSYVIYSNRLFKLTNHSLFDSLVLVFVFVQLFWQTIIFFTGTSELLPGEAEQMSLAGSTAGIIRNEYRHSNRSLTKRPISDTDSLDFNDITKRPISARPVISTSGTTNEAPIISLPYQVMV